MEGARTRDAVGAAGDRRPSAVDLRSDRRFGSWRCSVILRRPLLAMLHQQSPAASLLPLRSVLTMPKQKYQAGG